MARSPWGQVGVLLVVGVVLACCVAATRAWSRAEKPYPHYIEWSKEDSTFHEIKVNLSDLPADAPARRPEFYTTPSKEQAVNSTSQCGQDLIMLDILKNKTGGFFVDLAANDWNELSNSLYLERKFDWNGLCIEAAPFYQPGLIANRRCVLATNPVDTHAGNTVTFRQLGPFSGIADKDTDNNQELTGRQFQNRARIEKALITMTLTDVLNYIKAPPVIDFLSLDIEGAEERAMRHFDFNHFTFLVLMVERPKPELHHLLLRHRYVYLRENCFFGDVTYVHESLPDLAEVLKAHEPHRVGKWVTEHKYMLAPLPAHHRHAPAGR